MTDRNPPAPEIGDVYLGPPIGHGHPKLDVDSKGQIRRGRYYVRAIVDPCEHPTYGPQYKVVFRFHTRHKGWRYIIEDAEDLAFGLYTPIGAARNRQTVAVVSTMAGVALDAVVIEKTEKIDGGVLVTGSLKILGENDLQVRGI